MRKCNSFRKILVAPNEEESMLNTSIPLENEERN